MSISDFITLVQNAGSAAPATILAAVLIAIVWGLITDNVAFGPQLKRDREAHKTCNDALSKVTLEHTEARIELVSLRKDREYGWSQSSSPSSRPPERRP